MVNGGSLGTKDGLSAQRRCPHPTDLLGQPLVNDQGRVRGTTPQASVGRSRPKAWPEGTLGSVALETGARLEKLLDPESKGAWLHQTQLGPCLPSPSQSQTH